MFLPLTKKIELALTTCIDFVPLVKDEPGSYSQKLKHRLYTIFIYTEQNELVNEMHLYHDKQYLCSASAVGKALSNISHNVQNNTEKHWAENICGYIL